MDVNLRAVDLLEHCDHPARTRSAAPAKRTREIITRTERHNGDGRRDFEPSVIEKRKHLVEGMQFVSARARARARRCVRS